MLRWAIATIALVMSGMMPSESRAGFIVCNDTGVTVSVAVGWTPGGDTWKSAGWFNIEPRDCALPITGALSNRYIYYYAEGKSLRWEGGESSAFFCANHQYSFNYDDSDSTFGCDGY